MLLTIAMKSNWVTGSNCSCSVPFLHYWGQPCLCFVHMNSSAHTLSPHTETLGFQLNGSLLGPSVSKHTVISHQHQSKLFWFSFSLEKEVILYFPAAICSSAADTPSLQLTFSCFPLQSANFSQVLLFAFLKECILQAQASQFCSSDIIGIRWFNQTALKTLEGLLQSKQIHLSYFV